MSDVGFDVGEALAGHEAMGDSDSVDDTRQCHRPSAQHAQQAPTFSPLARILPTPHNTPASSGQSLNPQPPLPHTPTLLQPPPAAGDPACDQSIGSPCGAPTMICEIQDVSASAAVAGDDMQVC